MNSNDKKSKDNIIKRIKKCLAIAGDSAATSNEAATALRQAQALMREYDLSMIDVENADFKITQEFMKMARQQPKWKRYLFSSIAKAFGVHVMQTCELNKTTKRYEDGYSFYGINERPELTQYAFDVIMRQLRRAKKEFLMKKGYLSASKKRKIGEDFCLGFVYALDNKIVAFASDEKTKAKEDALVKKYEEQTGIRTKKSCSSRSIVDYDAYSFGQAAGEQVVLNHAMNNGQQSIKFIGND